MYILEGLPWLQGRDRGRVCVGVAGGVQREGGYQYQVTETSPSKDEMKEGRLEKRGLAGVAA